MKDPEIEGSPPHVRVILENALENIERQRITPACAGNTYI